MTRNIIVIVALLAVVTLAFVNYQQRKVIGELIELNHDKSVWIDAGCQGRYQGTEEKLPVDIREVAK